MVGAGGIGCELLKDLMLTGFGEINIVDLDTITLSNLNRQFLFRQKDIDKSKSLTVVKAVQKFNYFNTKLVPHHGNIMDTDAFPISWWSQFDYIYNALDNLEARRYVNKICLFLKKPLMESGTTGFEGQIQPIYPYRSECFDCQAKVTPTTFPVCTIRSTPSKPAHSITWAKEFLFHQLFEETATVDERELEQQRKQLESETDDKQEIENMLNETNELNDLKKTIHKGAETFIDEMINKIFINDIERLLMIESLWKFREPPKPLAFTDLQPQLNELLNNDENLDIIQNETKVWTLLENLYVLYKSSEKLIQRLSTEKEISFDKDDEDTLDFVVASSNIRSHIFNIEVKSKFDIKQIAGNIIPAIATTNAIISGLSSLESLKYYDNFDPEQSFKTSSTVFVSIKPNKYVTSASLFAANEKCASCSLSSKAIMDISESLLSSTTLKDLVQLITLTYSYEEISLILGNSKLIYDFDFDDNLAKSLKEIGFKFGDILLVQDEDESLENVELYINRNTVEAIQLTPLTLRPKKTIIDSPNPQDQDVEPQDKSDDSNTLILDDDQVEELVEEIVELEDNDDGHSSPENVDQPPTKKRKLV